jgi:tyrosyl-tRNA synthetase
MSKINKDSKKIKELLTRGVDEIIGADELEQKLQSGKKLRIKLGIDPTSPNLHLGRSVPLLKMRDFQELGHQVVLIVGDFTGVIGDTSDKDSERPMLDNKTIDANKKSYFKQIGKIIDTKKAELHYNSKWLKKLNYRDIGEQADLFSVADFIARDNIRRRLESGKRVSLREVLYPLMQGYDSVAIKADVELGGTDQRFNLLAGRHMQPHFNQPAQAIIMGPLVEGLDGRKMSSSWGNTINFNDEPSEMYGKIMSVRDDLLLRYFEMFTRVSLSEVGDVKQSLETGSSPKDIKQRLAREIVSMYHSEESAAEAELNWIQTFSEGGIPEDIPEVQAEEGILLADVLARAGLVSSKTEFRRLVESGAIKEKTEAGETKITDPQSKVQHVVTIKVGKRRFIRIFIKK